MHFLFLTLDYARNYVANYVIGYNVFVQLDTMSFE